MIPFRFDAQLARDVPLYRRMMPLLMPTRNESVVYFEQQLDVTETQAFITNFRRNNPELHATVFHVVMWALLRTLRGHPRLNRFVAGGRIWQRDGLWLSYSAKKAKSDSAPIVVIKRCFDDVEGFTHLVDTMLAGLAEGRSDKKSRVDKELRAFFTMPTPAVSALVKLANAADSLGVLPRSFIDGDPMFCSAFVANLGSIGMDAAFHHLYEYGNCPIFVVIGQTRPTPVVTDNGDIEVRPVMTIRYSYDERIADGFYAQRALNELADLVTHPEQR